LESVRPAEFKLAAGRLRLEYREHVMEASGDQETKPVKD
jgi:hypothetical protein